MPLVLLDRDGVINEDSTACIKSPDEWHPIPGSLDAIARLKRKGFAVAVCTNQSGVGRRLFDAETLAAIHGKMARALASHGAALDAIYHCPHRPEDGCDCRKPSAGLLERAMQDFGYRANDTSVVGDSIRDIEAALAAGCAPFLVRTGNGRRDESRAIARGAHAIFDDLAAAADWLIATCSAP